MPYENDDNIVGKSPKNFATDAGVSTSPGSHCPPENPSFQPGSDAPVEQ